MEKELIFLSGSRKLEQRVKKYINQRGEYVEKIPTLIAEFFPTWPG